MEKILLAVNAAGVNVNALDFACYIARLTRSKLTGVFLEGEPELEKKAAGSVSGKVLANTMAEENASGGCGPKTLCEDPIRFFKEACANRNVSCNVHLDRNVPVHEIISESRFADLLVIAPDTSFEKHGEAIPTRFVKDVLTYSECPVIVAPKDFNAIDEIVFTYDGSASSVFAIKQFTYLFPGLEEKKATVLHVNEHNDWAEGEKRKIGELLKPHYSIINFRHLHGKAKDELFGYLLGKENLFVVMGAFGRNMLSRLLRSSNAELIIKAVDLPVFVTHF